MKSRPINVDVILRRMRDLELSQVELSEAAGIRRTTLWRILSGETRTPHRRTVQGLAVALQVPWDELLAGALQLELFDHTCEGRPRETAEIRHLKATLNAQMERVPEGLLWEATRAAIQAVVSTLLATGSSPSPDLYESLVDARYARHVRGRRSVVRAKSRPARGLSEDPSL